MLKRNEVAQYILTWKERNPRHVCSVEGEKKPDFKIVCLRFNICLKFTHSKNRGMLRDERLFFFKFMPEKLLVSFEGPFYKAVDVYIRLLLNDICLIMNMNFIIS